MFRKVKYLLMACAVFVACEYDKMPLPAPAGDSASFGANDTSYVELFPVWDASALGYSFNHPVDISMGPDGLIFVADEGNDNIVVMTKAGALLQRDGLDGLDEVPHPQGVCVDSKLNVLITNGTNQIWCWNQYLNYAQLDSIARDVVVYDSQQDSAYEMTLDAYIDLAVHSDAQLPQIRRYVFKKDDQAIENARRMYPFFADEQSQAQINDVAAGSFGSGLVYATESTKDKILQIGLIPKAAFRNQFGNIVMQYAGVLVNKVVTAGSGAGTAFDPQGCIVDDLGNLYFTQLGGNFRVQKLLAGTFASEFVLYQDEIMDLGRFKSPYDLALDDDNNIFVVDAEQKQVFKFEKSGALADLGEKGLATARFTDARGIMAAENIIYVLESGKDRIRRFQYSVSEEDLPDVDENP
ncbi:MAG: hypothetical protein U5R06_14340 [candidate division KSB1 bacterium]|nr:hypothetical protein [candidate division KSB1 bacterium]